MENDWIFSVAADPEPSDLKKSARISDFFCVHLRADFYDLLFYLSMNFLAHCFLSHDDEDVLVGNFIGDFVKGRAWEQYAPTVQRGILLHRAIDGFTDAHALCRQSAARLRPYAGRYAPAVLDILVDHLLAQNWARYTAVPLDDFIDKTYEILGRRAPEFPAELAARLPFMLAGRFLDEYKTEAGMCTVLARFSRRVPLAEQGRSVLEAFFAEFEVYDADFQQFFPELMEEARRFLTT